MLKKLSGFSQAIEFVVIFFNLASVHDVTPNTQTPHLMALFFVYCFTDQDKVFWLCLLFKYC